MENNNNSTEYFGKLIDDTFLQQKNADNEFAEATREYEQSTEARNIKLRYLASQDYTDEVLTAIYQDCVTYLGYDSENFDLDGYKRKFSTPKTISIDDIHTLRKIEKLIEDVKKTDKCKKEVPRGWEVIYNFISKGGKSND